MNNETEKGGLSQGASLPECTVSADISRLLWAEENLKNTGKCTAAAECVSQFSNLYRTVLDQFPKFSVLEQLIAADRGAKGSREVSTQFPGDATNKASANSQLKSPESLAKEIARLFDNAKPGELAKSLADPALQQPLQAALQMAYRMNGIIGVNAFLHKLNEEADISVVIERNGTSISGRNLVKRDGTTENSENFAKLGANDKVKLCFASIDKTAKMPPPLEFSLSAKDFVPISDVSIHSDLPKNKNAQAVPSPYSIVAAFEKLTELCPPGTVWSGTKNGDTQECLNCIKLAPQLQCLGDMLQAYGTKDLNAINAWLKAQESPLKLKDGGDGALYAAAIIKVLGSWNGKKADPIITPDGKPHPAFTLDKSPVFFKVPGQTAPLVQLYEDKVTGIKVYAIEDDAARPGLEGAQFARDLLSKKVNDKNSPYGGIVAPCMDYDQSGDLSSLIGVNNQFGDKISQAKYNIKYAMDQDGFAAETGVAFGSLRGRSPERYEFGQKPIRIIVQSENTSYPLMTMQIGPQYWTAPQKPDKK